MADIGCGYALFDLFLAQEYGSKLALIDLVSNDTRHFGFRETGAAYSNLANTDTFLTTNGVKKSKIKTYNAEVDDLSEIKNPDYAFSFISRGYHYPLSTYEQFFKDSVRENGRIIVDIRARRLGHTMLEVSHDGYTRALVKAANNSADRQISLT